MKYAKSTGGFYSPSIHAVIPPDAVEITDEEHRALLAGQTAGKRIAPDPDGRPILIDPPPPTSDQVLATIKGNRLAAYRIESDPIFFQVQRGAATMDDWLAKVAEIRARYPDPV